MLRCCFLIRFPNFPILFPIFTILLTENCDLNKTRCGFELMWERPREDVLKYSFLQICRFLVDFGVLTLTKAGRRVRKLASERHIFSLRLKLRTNVEFSQSQRSLHRRIYLFLWFFCKRSPYRYTVIGTDILQIGIYRDCGVSLTVHHF